MDARTEALRERLLQLPTEELEFPFGGRTRVYRGPSLHAYATAHALLPTRGREGLASAYLLVTAEDDARAAVSMAEIDPRMTTRRVLLATEVDGEPLRMGVRLVMVGEGSRSLQGVVAVGGFDVALTPATANGAGGTAIELRGARLQRPGPADLDGIEQVEVLTAEGADHAGKPLAPRSYAGVPVHQLLARAGMYAMADDELVSAVVVATGADGRRAVLAAGEFGPRFNANPAIVALSREGEPLRDEGPTRLVVPYDLGPDRRVRWLVSLEVIDL